MNKVKIITFRIFHLVLLIIMVLPIIMSCGNNQDDNSSSSEIVFEDSRVAAICISNFDKNNDLKLTRAEAAIVTSLGTLFQGTSIKSFNELQYFIGLSEIGDRAFYNCADLNSLVIPNNVTRIGEQAFYGCKSLRKLIIPQSVMFIGKQAFEGCNVELIFDRYEHEAIDTADTVAADTVANDTVANDTVAE